MPFYKCRKKLRILIFLYSDQGHLVGSLKPSEIYQNTLVVEQIKQGQVVNGRIMTIIPSGVTVMIYGTTIKVYI